MNQPQSEVIDFIRSNAVPFTEATLGAAKALWVYHDEHQPSMLADNDDLANFSTLRIVDNCEPRTVVLAGTLWHTKLVEEGYVLHKSLFNRNIPQSDINSHLQLIAPGLFNYFKVSYPLFDSTRGRIVSNKEAGLTSVVLTSFLRQLGLPMMAENVYAGVHVIRRANSQTHAPVERLIRLFLIDRCCNQLSSLCVGQENFDFQSRHGEDAVTLEQAQAILSALQNYTVRAKETGLLV